ncbi:uncharacterized protein LACBIDRAFT_306321 [Laccaria bicolor S238N-H82]|uniref:Predicted protein n=1 Tax=Laccaria bicolor (strain S238N-H82 / ATCC MYA-4686) TaxID=486041 RepID=B0DN43_LACBS|nr:uncharacterized protein LACBIDRAFT_306321 [Laccaria bicolor S238N-H82]EDR03992.1 predicted protein [Laccaria bicolor S238N-H82]|eukprot:XP_001885247.1 predicted protein [Laccaria bicolor S238N-H82]
MSYASAQLSASAPGAHSPKPSSALATSFMGNWTSDDDLDNIGRQYSFCYNANFSKVGSQRYDAALSELVSYHFEGPQSKKAGNARTSSWFEDARVMELLSEDDVLDLADASKAELLDAQSTNAAVGDLEVTAAGTSAAPASLAMLGSMTPISTSSSAADWLNDDRVWDGENTTPECAPTHPTQSIKQSMKDGKESFIPKFKPFVDGKPSSMVRVTSGPGLGIKMTPTKSSEVYEAVVLASMASATSFLVPDRPRLTAVKSDEDIHVSPFMLSHPSLVASVSFAVSSPLIQNAPEAPRLYHNRVDVDSPTMSYTPAQIDAAQLVIQTPQPNHTSNMMDNASAALSSPSLQNAPKALRNHYARATADSPTTRYSSAQIDDAQLVNSPKFNLISNMTASVSFADSSPLLQNAPKAPRLYHAKLAMDSPTTTYSSTQIDEAQLVKTPEHISRRRNVHGSRTSMHYTNNTFDGPLDTPSKPSSYRTFLSSERMQIAHLNAALASRPQIYDTPSKIRMSDSPLLEKPERRVLASNTSLDQHPSPESNSTCLDTSVHFNRPVRSGPPVSPRLPPAASPLEPSSFVTPQKRGPPSISMRLASPRVKTRYASFASPTPLPSNVIKSIPRMTPQDDASAKVELSTSSSLSISFPRVETMSGLTEQASHVSLVSNSSSLQENTPNPSLNPVSSPRSLGDLFSPSARGEPIFPNLYTSEQISEPGFNISPAPPHLPLPSSYLGPYSSVCPQNDVETRNVSLISPHTSILASSIESVLYAARSDAPLKTSTLLSFSFPRLTSIPETTEQVDDVPPISPDIQNLVLDPFSPLPSPCNISPALGTTDSSLRISKSFEGLGLGLPSTLTSESLADKATYEDSPLLDVVCSQANASGNTERPRLPSQLASGLNFPDDHSGSSDITLFDSIDSDQVERTTSVEDAAVTALLEALSSFEQQRESYDLLPSRSFMQLHRFPKRSLYDIPEADTPPATPPTPLPTSAHIPDASSYTNDAIEQTPHASSSSSTETDHISEASTYSETSHISEPSHSFSPSTQTFHTPSQSSPSSLPQTPHAFSDASTENIVKPKNIIKSARRLAVPACLSSLTFKNQKQQQPSLAAINAATHHGQPSEQTPHALSPSENTIKPKNNINPVRGLAASACSSSLTLKSQKQQPSLAVADAPSQPSANAPPVASSSSKNIFKSVRRLAASALSSLTLKKPQSLIVNLATHPTNQPSEHTPQLFANTPQPSTDTPEISSSPFSTTTALPPSFSENDLKSARGPAASASLSSLPPKKQNQPQRSLVPGDQPSNHTPQSFANAFQPSTNTPQISSPSHSSPVTALPSSSSENNSKSARGPAAPASLSSLPPKKQKQPQPSLVPGNQPSNQAQSFANAPQPSTNTPQISSSTTTTPLPSSSSSKNDLKSARRPAASACLSLLPPKKQNQPKLPLALPFSSSKNNLKLARGPAASACLSSLPSKKQSQPKTSSLVIITAESPDSASPPLTTGLNGSQDKGADGSNRLEGSKSGARIRWPFNHKFRWTTLAESEEIIASSDMGSSSNEPPPMSPQCIIHEDVPRTTLGVNGDGGRGKGVLKFLF